MNYIQFKKTNTNVMKYFLFLFVIFLSLISNAQKKANFLKIHGGAEIPVGFFSEGYSTGWGIYATDYLEVNKGGSLLLTTGFTGWKAEIGQGIKANLFIMRMGYRIFATEGLYFQIDAAGFGAYLDEHNNGTRFTYAGGLGYLFSKKNKNGFDISAKFNRISDRSWISLNLGYQFKL